MKVWKRNQGIGGAGRRSGGQLPQARVVIGKHAPDWAQVAAQPAAEGNVSYVRMSAPASATLAAAISGFWPVIVIVGMGIALLWSGALAHSP